MNENAFRALAVMDDLTVYADPYLFVNAKVSMDSRQKTHGRTIQRTCTRLEAMYIEFQAPKCAQYVLVSAHRNHKSWLRLVSHLPISAIRFRDGNANKD